MATRLPVTIAGPSRPHLPVKPLQTGRHGWNRFLGSSRQRPASPLTPVPIRPRVQAPTAAKTPQDPGLIPIPTATLNTLDADGKVLYQMQFPVVATNPLISTLSVSPISQININTKPSVVNPQAPSAISIPVAAVASTQESDLQLIPSDGPSTSQTVQTQSPKPVTLLQKKHVIMKNIGTFEVFLRHPTGLMPEDKNHQFVCLCFDLGSFWVSHENSGFLDTIKLNKTIRASFLHTDASRNTYDHAVLHLGTRKMLAYKPGTATETLKLVKNKNTFFLQEGALLKVNALIETDFKQRFVAKAKKLLNSSDNWQGLKLPNDFKHLKEIAKLTDDQIVTLDDDEDDDEPVVISSNPGSSKMNGLENGIPIVSNTGPSHFGHSNGNQISGQPIILPSYTCNQGTIYQTLNYAELYPCQPSLQNPGSAQPELSMIEVRSQPTSSSNQLSSNLVPIAIPTSSSSQGFMVSNVDSLESQNTFVYQNSSLNQSRHVNQCSYNQKEIQSYPVYTSTSQTNFVMNRMSERNSNTIFEPSTTSNIPISNGVAIESRQSSDASQSFQYEALSKSHWKAILFCKTCQWNFQFLVEWVIHFNVIDNCRKSIRQSYPEEMSLYEVFRLHCKKLGNLETYGLKCNECNQVLFF